MEVIHNNTSDHRIFNPSQDFSTEFPSPQLRPRSHSAPQERINSTLQSIISHTLSTLQQHSNSSTTNSQNDSQQRRYKDNCYCGLEPTLREVKKENQNKGRFFWSCSKFRGPDHERRCDFFRWDTQNGEGNDVRNDGMAEEPSTDRNRSYVSMNPVVGTASPTENNDDGNDDDNNNNDDDDGDDGDDGDVGDDGDDDVNLSPHPDQRSENVPFLTRSFPRTRVTSNTTPITSNRRFRNFRRRASLPQSLGSPPARSQSPLPLDTT